MRKAILILSILFVSCTHIEYVKIVRVHDGDTVTTSEGERIRLNKIDAPEIGQQGGEEAKVFVAQLILNKDVKLITHGKDKYNRTIADVYCDGIYINKLEVKKGFCFVYKKYSSKEFYSLFQKAKQNGLGIFSNGNKPEPPYLYRKDNRP